MGVKGLQTFLKENQRRIAGKIDLYDTKLVIDANNLCYEFYQYFCLDRKSKYRRCDIYGVDFIGFGDIVREFFVKLKRCNIVPILVFDGSDMNPYSERDDTILKEKTACARAKEKMRRAIRIREEHCKKHNGTLSIPRNIKYVFKAIAIELGLEIVPTPYEADFKIARVANQLNCPVLSNDSDFIIYPLKKGFILLDSIIFQKVVELNAQYCLPALLYSIEGLAKIFLGLDAEVLPLFSVLIGNDYVLKYTFSRITNSICLKPYTGSLIKGNKQNTRLANLFDWLCHKSLKDALAEILDPLPIDRQHVLRAKINKFLDCYKVDVDGNFLNELRLIYPEEESVSNDPDQMPAIYLNRLMKKDRLGTIVIDAIFRNTHFVRSIIDDVRLISSGYVKYRPYSMIYTLLRSKSDVKTTTDNKEEGDEEEDALYIFDRVGLEYRELMIDPITYLYGFGPTKDLDCYSMVALSQEKKKNLLMATFRFGEEELESMKAILATIFRNDFLHEALISMMLIKYIGQETKMQPKPQFVEALILTLSYYAAQKGDLIGVSQDGKNQLLKHLEPHSIMKNRLKYSDDPSLYRRIIHFISQLESALFAYSMLNDLLDRVLYNPNLGLFFNGVLMFRITKLLRTGQETLQTLCEGLPEVINVCGSVEAQVLCDE